MRRAVCLVALAMLGASCAGPRPAQGPAPAGSTAPGTTLKGSDADLDFQLGVWMPALAAPRLDSLGRVNWTPAPVWSAERSRIFARLARGEDTLAVWRAEAADPAAPLRPFLLARIARAELARGDTARARADLDTLRSLPGPWQWEAVRTLADLAVARGDVTAADSVLGDADRAGWSDLERAAWLVRRARLRAQRGDTAAAEELARQSLRRYPSLAPTRGAVRLLESIAVARMKPLRVEDELAAAEVERLQGLPHEAARRLTRAEAASPAAERPRLAVRLAEVFREARRYDEGLTAAARALKRAKEPELKARASLVRARLLRDADRESEALEEYQRLARSSAPAETRMAAAWELGLELEAAGRFARARDAYGIVVALGGARRDDARLRRGLLWVVEGDTTRGLAEWGTHAGEAFEFWRASLRRGTHRATSDSTLRTIAARPGYGFYRAAARDTLTTRGVVPVGGWTGVPPATAAVAPADTALLGLAERLAMLGESADAMLVLQRWAAQAADSVPGPTRTASALAAARIAFGLGRYPTGIRFAQKALDASARAPLEAQWAVQPWIYPPAFDSLYAAHPARPDSNDSLDAATLRAVAWQESRFDPAARSRSNALGLYQLKLATAGDVARRLREPPPTEEALFDPARSLRFGRGYLRWLESRTDSNLVVAIAAYNSGPGALPEDWRTRVARGGDVLFCELLGRAETRDYVRLILGARQAYRELLSPRVAP